MEIVTGVATLGGGGLATYVAMKLLDKFTSKNGNGSGNSNGTVRIQVQ